MKPPPMRHASLIRHHFNRERIYLERRMAEYHANGFCELEETLCMLWLDIQQALNRLKDSYAATDALLSMTRWKLGAYPQQLAAERQTPTGE